jgi:hypothetical protein
MVAGKRVFQLGRLHHGSFAVDTVRLERMRKVDRAVHGSPLRFVEYESF